MIRTKRPVSNAFGEPASLDFGHASLTNIAEHSDVEDEDMLDITQTVINTVGDLPKATLMTPRLRLPSLAKSVLLFGFEIVKHDYGSDKDAKGSDVDLSTYKGKALLIVNVASQWSGNTSISMQSPVWWAEEGRNERADCVEFACTRFKRFIHSYNDLKGQPLMCCKPYTSSLPFLGTKKDKEFKEKATSCF
ncbi:hypothetical protein Scep_005241 [Stephania cephalantha]|uniref:Uncharacterized protein n=1 Tax=Stephania cephalantha TaxID=152367 RepID=A0AAP0KTX8_9MAGN